MEKLLIDQHMKIEQTKRKRKKNHLSDRIFLTLYLLLFSLQFNLLSKRNIKRNSDSSKEKAFREIAPVKALYIWAI